MNSPKQNRTLQTPATRKNPVSESPSSLFTQFNDMKRVEICSCLITLTFATALLASAEPANKSGGLVWSTSKDEGELLASIESEDGSSTTVLEDTEGLDGGFSSLEGMLQWAIGHSDPTKLKEGAEDAKKLSPVDLQKRQNELKEMMERMKTPSDVQLMQIAIHDLKNASLSLEDQRRALEELLILTEPIDNSNDFNKLGGFVAILPKLSSPDLEIRKSSAWVIGKACQNNPLTQKQVLDLGALPKLLMMVKSDSPEEAIKALYAVSAMIRNNLEGQELFYKESGGMMLQDILSNLKTDIRLRRKAVFLLGDLVECQLEATNGEELPLFSDQNFLKSVVNLLSSNDLDLQEKALLAIKNLLRLRSTDAMILRDFCALGNALANMHKQLSNLMAEDVAGGYVTDVESLRRDVEHIFHAKLQQDRQVPT